MIKKQIPTYAMHEKQNESKFQHKQIPLDFVLTTHIHLNFSFSSLFFSLFFNREHITFY